MVDRIYCKACDEGVTFETSANYMVFCPNCFSLMKLVYDYSSETVVPCYIYLGSRKIGEINCDSKGYYLRSPYISFFAIRLSKTGAEALYEAKDIIRKRLGERMKDSELASNRI